MDCRARLLLTLLLAAALAFPLRADLEVNVRPDKIVLKDGTELTCIVLMVTPQGVLIVETDPDDETKTRQRVVPTAQVAKVIPGEPDGSIAGLQTNTELARKVIQGSGFRKEEKPEKSKGKAAAAEKGKGKPKGAGKSAPKAAEEAAAEPEETHASKPAASRGAQPEPAPAPAPAPAPSAEERVPEAPAPVPDAGPAPVAGPSRFTGQELAAAYAGRFPQLQFYAQQFAGPEQAARIFEEAKADPQAKAQLEGFLKLLVAEDTSILGERKVYMPQVQKKPPKQRRTPRAPPVKE